MNFIINVNPTRAVGKLHELNFSISTPKPERHVLLRDAKIYHLEYRHLPGTDDDFIALIYKLPKPRTGGLLEGPADLDE